MDRFDKQMMAALSYGDKRQSELIELLDTTSNTLKNHADHLIEQGYIAKEKYSQNKVIYKLVDGPDEIHQAKPWADPNDVECILRPIQSALEKHHSSDGHHRMDEACVTAAKEFSACAQEHYFVVDKDSNFEEYLGFLDYFLADMRSLDEQTMSTVPDRIYHDLLSATTALIDNWEQGKEHEELYGNITERGDTLVNALKTCPETLEYPIQSIAEHLGRDKAKRAFKIRVKKGACKEAALLTDAFFIYDAENDIDGLLDDLDEIVQEFESQQASDEVERIQNLQTEVKELYTREYEQVYDRLKE